MAVLCCHDQHSVAIYLCKSNRELVLALAGHSTYATMDGSIRPHKLHEVHVIVLVSDDGIGEITAKSVFMLFRKEFSAQRSTNGTFSQVPMDQAIEQTVNRHTKPRVDLLALVRSPVQFSSGSLMPTNVLMSQGRCLQWQAWMKQMN